MTGRQREALRAEIRRAAAEAAAKAPPLSPERRARLASLLDLTTPEPTRPAGLRLVAGREGGDRDDE